MNTADDTQLIAAAQAGDTASFGVLYDEYIEPVYRFVYFKTHHKETAEDLTSFIFLKALEQLSSFHPQKGPFRAWLYTIARNTITDHYRRESKKRHMPIEDAWELPSSYNTSSSVENRLCIERLREWTKDFSAVERDVLMLRIWQGLSHKEIAAAIGKTETNCKQIYSRAIEKLKYRIHTI